MNHTTKNKVVAVLMLFCCNCMFGESPEALYKKGIDAANEGKKKQAFTCFKNAAKIAPDSARYHFAAAQTSPDQNTAFMYTKCAWEKGMKNQIVMTLLLNQSFHLDKKKKLEYAMVLFGELPDSLRTDMLKGELYFQFDIPDSAYALWNSEFIRTEKSFLCPKIANALARMGKPDQAIDFLYKCKNDNLLDADGITYLASLLAIRYNYPEVERLFADISKSNLYNDQIRLEYATYLAFHDRFDEAMRLFELPAGPGSPMSKALFNLRFTTLKFYSAMVQQKKDLLPQLLAIDEKDTVIKKQKTVLFTAMKAFVNNDTAAFTLLKSALQGLPPDPVTILLCADAGLKRKQYEDVVVLYASLPGIVLWSPRIVVARAQALAMSGDDDEALKVISFMHKQRIFTRTSLELFRNLTLKKDLLDKSTAAQQLLEQQYSNDIGLKWRGLLLAIKSEKYDSALAISRVLSEQYPDDERFILTELTILLMKKEFRMVLDKAAKCKLPDIKIKPIEAAAFKGLGDTTMAIAAYESVIQKRNEPLLVMQLAEMYYQKKMYDKATGLYTKLIEAKADSLSNDSLQLAVLLNNNAWTIMTSGAEDLTGALSMAKKAYEMASNNLHIIDTYASILYDAKRFRECIALIEANKESMKQKRLICHIARSYEKLKDKNKAKRYYEDALALGKDDQKLSLLISDELIKEEIYRLTIEK